ncbi:hypothetical protein M378DRAFT_303324 [Amanita muscaria Koide BX008]|uniref:Response regulatory domain-containing protein n=1 Tax=Amanita muscaria (strain Koide BX008) TaxID=946122 RepID=A0A0C2WZW8_AMAMK|nr:hypothetical protein M378DRAFT_303324 [Amanita muscaria Koide BX008]
MNPPNLPAVRLQLVGDGDCTLYDALDVAPSHEPDSDPRSVNTADTDYFLYPTVLPHFSRSLSSPPSSRLPMLRNPLRDQLERSLASSRSASCHEISLELADSLQSVMQSLLHVSPQQVLDPAKEQFAACTLSVPTPCMSAMFSIMKSLNYVSANMAALSAAPEDPSALTDFKIPHAVSVDFDVGELLQNVGDGLSGAAAQVGADLVLYHGDVGLKHVWVKGDEDGLSYALAHTIRRILHTAHRGDTIELGLLMAPTSQTETGSLTESDGPLKFTFVISHKFCAADLSEEQTRPTPFHYALVLQRILRHLDATLVSDLPPPPNFTYGRTCELRLTLPRGKFTRTAPIKSEAEADVVASEPSLEQLISFAETLKGKRVALYASSKGSFAQHFTSYLTAWGMDVSHVSPEGNVEGFPVASDMSKPSEPQGAAEDSSLPPKDEASDQVLTPNRFIVIDDDVNILKDRLYSLRNDYHSMRRPSLASLHRPPSSPPLSSTVPLLSQLPSEVIVLHFTSLSNYKTAKDVLQTVVACYTKSNIPAPEVMIIPKPAGPRRLLTALHTAVTKPVIDPLFLPIATAPQSPGIFAHGNFFGSYASGSAPSVHRLPSKSVISRPNGGRTNTDRSARSSTSSDHPSLHPTSPLGAPDSVEYFSRAAYRLGGSPSSGLVIQSPDGQPAGIFFHPRVKGSSRTPSTQSMERDKGQLALPERRQSVGRVTPNQTDKNASSLANQVQSSAPAPSAPGPPPPAPATRASSATGVPPTPAQVKPILRSQSGPGPEQASTSSAPEVQSPAPVAAQKPDTMQAIVQAVSTPTTTAAKTTTPTRRSVPRRRTAASGSTLTAPTSPSSTKSSTKKKGKAPENIIVPPISVLIVDDNPINQTILSTFMKKKLIRYDIASNGQEAVEKWKTGVFHLILMDIQMPILDGIEATKEIRRLEKSAAEALYPTTPISSPAKTPSELVSPESRVPHSPYHPSVIIVALTASSLQSDRVAALGAGCNDFLTKPVSLLWLNSKIIEWGSIKALQMWADLRPSVMRSITQGQQAQARSVAERLHVPSSRKALRLQTAATSQNGPSAKPVSSSSPNISMPNVAPPGTKQGRSDISNG